MAKLYSEKLKDPRWQKKRLEVLQRNEFTCQECGSTEDTLHVHHRYYERGKNPWEYPDESMETLCFICHSREGYIKKIINERVDDYIKSGGSYRHLSLMITALETNQDGIADWLKSYSGYLSAIGNSIEKDEDCV